MMTAFLRPLARLVRRLTGLKSGHLKIPYAWIPYHLYDDGAAWVCRGADPTCGHVARSIFADLDRGPEPVETEPCRKLAGLLARDIDEEAVPVGGDEEIEQDLALRGEQAGMDAMSPLGLADIVRD